MKNKRKIASIPVIALLAASLLASCSPNTYSSKYPLPPTRPIIKNELLLDREKAAQDNQKVLSTGAGGITAQVLRHNGTDSTTSAALGILAAIGASKTTDHYQTKERIEMINQMSDESFSALTRNVRANNLEFTRFASEAEETTSALGETPSTDRGTKEFKSHVKASRSFLRKQDRSVAERSKLLKTLQEACARPNRVKIFGQLQTQMQKSKLSLEASIRDLDSLLK